MVNASPPSGGRLFARDARLLGAAVLVSWSVVRPAPVQGQGRDAWQRVPEVLEALAAGPGSVVADVGAGDGFYTTRLARLVGGAGRVFAVDIAADALRRLRALADTLAQGNVTVVEGRADDPLLPRDSLDAVLIVNAYHEMTAHDAMLARLLEALRSGGRLVLLEPLDAGRDLETREAQARAHTIAPSFVREDLERAGFEVLRLEEGFARTPGSRRTYWLMIARRPPAVGPP
jgi:predicted methyltransferase